MQLRTLAIYAVLGAATSFSQTPGLLDRIVMQIQRNGKLKGIQGSQAATWSVLLQQLFGLRIVPQAERDDPEPSTSNVAPESATKQARLLSCRAMTS